MERKTIKWMIVFLFLIYLNCLTFSVESFYDDIALIIFFSLLIWYNWLRIKFFMTEKRLKNFGDESTLEYKIESDLESKKMLHMYVRPRIGLVWYELYYPYTIKEGVEMRKAKLFADKIANIKKLKLFMEKKYGNKDKIDEEIYLKEDIKSMTISYFILLIMVILIIFSIKLC